MERKDIKSRAEQHERLRAIWRDLLDVQGPSIHLLDALDYCLEAGRLRLDHELRQRKGAAK